MLSLLVTTGRFSHPRVRGAPEEELSHVWELPLRWLLVTEVGNSGFPEDRMEGVNNGKNMNQAPKKKKSGDKGLCIPFCLPPLYNAYGH